MDKLEKARSGGFLTKLGIYGKMSGPGWVQAAVTLGGGSLASALYLGIIGGYEFLWLQPLAMICGIIMLSAISYVTLSTKERPFRQIEKKVSPALAWGWLIATVIANTVFCAAQFALGRGAMEGNLGWKFDSPYVLSAALFIVSFGLLLLSQKGGKASQILDNVLKVLVGLIVLAFLAVVATLLFKGDVNLAHLGKGLIPNFSALFEPTEEIAKIIETTGEHKSFWTEYVAGAQRNKIIAAFGTAVAINMTFLLPYSLKAKGWGKKHRELSRFDLALGLFVPFVLGASALVIASAASFHAKHGDIIDDNGKPLNEEVAKVYYKVVDTRLAKTHPNANKKEIATLRENLPLAEKKMAATLADRSQKNLAKALEPSLGKHSQLIFGIGVLAMALSTMLVHMMMNGYAISEAVNKVGSSKVFIIGALMPALSGLLSPIVWDGPAKATLAINASVIATVLLPIAYLAFLLLINSKSALGDELPKRRCLVNALMIISMGVATFAAMWKLYFAGIHGMIGLIALAVLAIVGVLGFIKRNKAM